MPTVRGSDALVPARPVCGTDVSSEAGRLNLNCIPVVVAVGRRLGPQLVAATLIPSAAPRVTNDYMGKPRNTGFRRIVNATIFSFSGFRTAWRDEAAFRQEALLCVVLVPTAFWLGRTAVERALLIGSCLLVLVVELLNTGIENVVDRIGQERHQLSGQAKDMGSAAVFTSLMLTLVIWCLIAWERFGPALHDA